MGRIELAGFLAGIGCEVGDQVFINEAQHVVILPAIHRDALDQMQQVADGLCTGIGCFTQLGKPGLQRLEDVFEHLLMGRIDQAAEGRQGDDHMINIEVRAHVQPGIKQVFIADEVTDCFLDAFHRLAVFSFRIALFRPCRIVFLVEAKLHVFIVPVLADQVLDLTVRKELVENETEDIILVLVCFNLGTHLVGGFPDFRGQLLFVHRFSFSFIYFRDDAQQKISFLRLWLLRYQVQSP